MPKTKYVNIVTPKGTARYPKLSEPDTKGEYADGKFKTEIVLDEADTKALKKQMYDAAKELLPHVKAPRLPIKTAKDGTVSFIFKSQRRPMVQDAQKNDIPASVEVGGGSIIRIAGVLAPYEKGTLVGITAYLDAVRVLELKQFKSSAEAFGEAEDGFRVSDSDVAAQADSFDAEQPQDEYAL